MRKLHGQMRHYPWGSRAHLAELTGRPVPSAEPEAEIWYGAHPAEPCRLGDDGAQSLTDLIAADPLRQLGTRCVRQFGPELPFLLKLLAAGEPLSLQAHPSSAQAREGFARENALGLPPDDPRRNYKDANHKPELLVALTDFEALAGYDDPRQVLRFVEELAVPSLQPTAGLLRDFPSTAVFAVVTATWVKQTAQNAAELVDGARAGFARLAAREDAFGDKARMLLRLADRHPADPGVLVAMLLHHIRLRPGEGLSIPAGVLHAHLDGLGVEIMANSDNVLRGGLTGKHVDTDELLAVLDFTPAPLEKLVVEGRDRGDGETWYPTPAGEFALASTDLAPGAAAEAGAQGPRILLCAAGSVTVGRADERVELRPGEAVWLSAEDDGVTVAASAENARVFRAWLP